MLAIDTASSQAAVIFGTVLVIVISTYLFFMRKPKESIVLDDLINSEETWDNGDTKAESKVPNEHSNSGSDVQNDKLMKQDLEKLKNVFDVKQPPPKVGNPKSSGTKGTEKPFKSSYYYAHNQMKKTGGYKDGLKAEDYVMNGPKLLSKNSTVEIAVNKTLTTAQAATKLGKGNSIPINRYLWDDDGNASGVAKIYIDSLPGKTSASSSNWADTNISKDDVIAKLVGDSKDAMIIQIRRNEVGQQETRYHLYVPKMYGEVEDVKTIVKAKKLIVKLTKKKGNGNSKSWPQLPSKKSVSASSNGVDYVNEDLFLQE